MDLPINRNDPLVMHIDLNSCFATVKQQASLHLRGKPLVIAAYQTPGGCIISPSIEAKKLGIKVGMTVREAKIIFPEVIVRTPDPAMVRDVHIKFRDICRRFSPDVFPKSIDEVVIDFSCLNRFVNKNLTEIGKEIKKSFREEIGEWISCNIGIGPNRFLAKLASSLHKPDGLDVISYKNLIEVFKTVKLIDLSGINSRFAARLNAAGIFSPLEFLKAKEDFLRKQVFKSILGYYWYLRLRGYEIDDIEFKRKSFGQDYALYEKTSDVKKLSRIIMKLCEKMGRRLRKSGYAALGIHLGLLYNDWTFWHQGQKFPQPIYTTAELFTKAMLIFNRQPKEKIVSKISVSGYDLLVYKGSQTGLFDEAEDKGKKVSRAMDKINDRFGEYVITPALMMGMENLVLDRIAFGGTKELEDLYI